MVTKIDDLEGQLEAAQASGKSAGVKRQRDEVRSRDSSVAASDRLPPHKTQRHSSSTGLNRDVESEDL